MKKITTIGIATILISLCLIQSCTSKSSNNQETKNFAAYHGHDKNIIQLVMDSAQVLKIKDPIDGSLSREEMIDTCLFVKLETNDNCLFGNIDKILIDSTGIYIMDSREAESIFRFDREGHFLNKIGKTGRGPGEYIFPQDFDILDGEVYVFNGNQSKIFKYSVDGVYLNEISLNMRCNAFSVLSSDKIVLYAESLYPNNHLGNLSQNHLFLMNQKGEILDAAVKKDNRLSNLNFTNQSKCLFKQANGISFSPDLSDTIYEIQDTTISVKYAIDLGNNKIDIDNFSGLDGHDFYEKIGKSSKVTFDGKHFETKDHLCFSLSQKHKVIRVFYDKNSKQIKYGARLKHDKMFYVNLDFVGATNDYFISLLGSDLLCNLNKQLEATSDTINYDRTNRFIQLVMGATLNDNPILVLSKMKRIK